MHHVPALFLHPSRRLRTLALTAHAEILRAEPLRAQMFFFLREVASAEQVESIVGSWCLATRDQDRHVAPIAQSSWDAHVSLVPTNADAAADASSLVGTVEGEGEDEKFLLDGTRIAALLVFVQRALLDPLALHAYLNPVQVPVDVSVPRTGRGKLVPTVSAAAQTRRTDGEPMARTKGESEEESEMDRKARLRIGSLGALQWILGTYTVSSR
jgi:E3 ubiquitin-protein ligase listerin